MDTKQTLSKVDEMEVEALRALAIRDEDGEIHHRPRPRCELLDAILGLKFPILDKGYISVIDYMGTDMSVADAARMSYQMGTKQVTKGTGVLGYLMRHQHTTPFEQCSITFHLKLPMFIGEQVLRQRTAKPNKESGRYSILSEDKYVPNFTRIMKQSKTNGQGSDETTFFSVIQAMEIVGKVEFVHKQVQDVYTAFVSEDVDLARELARGILPANQYASMVWTIDLHNLFKFLHQRTDSHAQWEIQQYANFMERIVSLWVPVAHKYWVRYVKDALHLSSLEVKLIQMVIRGEPIDEAIARSIGMDGRGEWPEFLAKLERLQ